MKTHRAQRIVNEVLRDLDDRRGFHLISELQSSDPEVYRELYSSCVNRVKKAWSESRKAAIEGNEDSVQEDYYYPADYEAADYDAG